MYLQWQDIPNLPRGVHAVGKLTLMTPAHYVHPRRDSRNDNMFSALAFPVFPHSAAAHCAESEPHSDPAQPGP